MTETEELKTLLKWAMTRWNAAQQNDNGRNITETWEYECADGEKERIKRGCVLSGYVVDEGEEEFD